MKLTKEQKQKAIDYINQNVWDGEDRYNADKDFAIIKPKILQDLVIETFEHVLTGGN